MSVLRSRLFFSKILGDFYPRHRLQRLCAGASVFVIAMSTAGCTESILGYNETRISELVASGALG